MDQQPPRLGPVAEAGRIDSLDTLRGFALLGILAMNIQSFAMPGAAYFFPEAYGDLQGVNRWVWYASEILARNKFMGLFSMLFGAGIVLMHERATAAGRALAGLHYRRMGVLWLFGMIHAYLLWDGDILVSYALCGLLLYWFRRVRPGGLLAAGLIFLAVGAAFSLMGGLSAPHWPAEDLAEFENRFRPGAELLAEEIGARRGGWFGEIAFRAPEILSMHFFYFPYHILWRAGGFMLVGMALFRWGALTGAASRRLYLILTALGLLIGLPMVVHGVRAQSAAAWDPVYCFFIGSLWNYWGALPVALAYMSLIMLMCRGGLWRGLTRRLAAVGRMAFSNYLAQTLICTTLFNGRGLALFGQVDRATQAGIVLGVWVLQLIVSPLWLRRFRFGPAEWLWRSLSYRRRQPMRRRVGVSPSG